MCIRFVLQLQSRKIIYEAAIWQKLKEDWHSDPGSDYECLGLKTLLYRKMWMRKLCEWWINIMHLLLLMVKGCLGRVHTHHANVQLLQVHNLVHNFITYIHVKSTASKFICYLKKICITTRWSDNDGQMNSFGEFI